MTDSGDAVLVNGRFTTLAADGRAPAEAQAVVVRDGRVAYAGDEREARERSSAPTVDLGGRRVLPGLIDSHVHFVRAGLTWNEEVRWEAVPDLDGALALIADAARTRPAGQWIKVVGGWHPDQFTERRGPSRQELDDAAPEHPVFVQCRYSWGMLNSRGMKAIDLGRARGEGVDPGDLDTDESGADTGVLRGMSALRWLYWQFPVPSLAEQCASTAAASRGLSRVGLTGVIDGGGSNTGPDSYRALFRTWRSGELTLRVRTTVHSSRPGAESDELPGYLRYVEPRFGDDTLRVLGLGEIVHYSVHDGFGHAGDLSAARAEEVTALLGRFAEAGWTVHFHAVRPDTLAFLLDAWEKVDATVPLAPLRWSLVHGEGLDEAMVDRIAALGVGVAAPAMMRFEADDCVSSWGRERASVAPPLRALLDAGVAVGGGTDAMRVASYYPFTALHWYVTGRTVGGDQLRSGRELLTRAEALTRYTSAAAWFSYEEDQRGRIEPGMLADLTVLDRDYFAVPEDEIPAIGVDATLLGGRPSWVSPDLESSFSALTNGSHA